MKIGKDLDLFDGPDDSVIEGRPTYVDKLPQAEINEDGMVEMMESLGWNVSQDNILVVPDGDSKIIIRNLNREQ
jgi:hypothetical protein|tara:strand:+ start:63 stop:284 length:222 start_codon:yes stop_codon:yes gene_type:complete